MCNSNGQIVIAERFDRWIMTSNDTPRWESKPPPPAACPMQPPSALPSPPRPAGPGSFLLCASLRHVLPLPHEGADVDMRLRHAYAAAFGIGLCARPPITAVKLDCRRLSPADRPNKTRIFSSITAVHHYLAACAARLRSCILWGTMATPVDIYAPALFADNVEHKRETALPPPPFRAADHFPSALFLAAENM